MSFIAEILKWKKGSGSLASYLFEQERYHGKNGVTHSFLVAWSYFPKEGTDHEKVACQQKRLVYIPGRGDA